LLKFYEDFNTIPCRDDKIKKNLKISTHPWRIKSIQVKRKRLKIPRIWFLLWNSKFGRLVFFKIFYLNWNKKIGKKLL